ncbi:MAG: Sec-independent protein translocase protein TatB [Xanthomonadaceae bacterium]|nr:Sec-independent protein translocase protein TatB [Xanthomonadaceae bacterium]
MFGLGFWELLVIAVLCLIVVGPQRLPRLARTLGVWTGRAKLMLQQVRAEVDREIEADELRDELKRTAREVKEAVDDERR